MEDPESGKTPVVESADCSELEKLLDAEVALDGQPAAPTVNGLRTGTLIGFRENGAVPLVSFSEQSGVVAVSCRTTVDLRVEQIGRRVVVMFEGTDLSRPIIIGWLRDAEATSPGQLAGHAEVEADGERLIVSARQGLVLRCGKASIVLSPDGKIVLRGSQIVSHASGLNRIKGGSVQVN